MAKDRVGNDLEKGDFVSMMVQSQRNSVVLAEVFGHIVAISDGGIVAPGGQRGRDKKELVTPGVIKVRFEMDVYFDPAGKMSLELLKLHDPAMTKTGILQ